MALKTILLAVTVAPMLWAAPTNAASREVHFKVKYSGSAVSLSFAGLGTVSGKSNLGRWTSQGVGKATVTGPGTCANGNPGITLTLVPGTGHAFARFESTQDLVFSELTSETVCYDPSTRMQFKTGTDRITGGTGRFAGATGESQFEGTQWPLYVDADGNGFAAQTGTVTGTIVLHGSGARERTKGGTIVSP